MAIFGITVSLALVANTANQVVFGVVSAGTSSDGAVTWLDVTMDAATPAQGVKLELVRYTGGIPTLTSTTPVRLSADAQAVAASGMATVWIPPITATPTGPTPIKTWYAPPTGGLLVQYPLKREDWMPAAASAWVGLRASTAAGVSPNLAFNFSWDE